jgi:hypothetical protein
MNRISPSANARPRPETVLFRGSEYVYAD